MTQKVFIMAAGLGTRMKPFSDAYPKPLLPVLDIPTAFYGMKSVLEIGMNEFIINIHPHAEIAKKGFLEFKNFSKNQKVKISFSDETKLLLGSGGGYRKALEILGGEPFLSFNGDSLSLSDPIPLVMKHNELRKTKNVVMTLALIRNHNYTGEYRNFTCNENTSLVTNLGEKQKNANFWSGWAMFEPEAFHHLELNSPSEFVENVLLHWIRNEKVGFCEYKGIWEDIGSPQSWADAHFKLLKNIEKDSKLTWLKNNIVKYGPTSWHSKSVSQSLIKNIKCDELTYFGKGFSTGTLTHIQKKSVLYSNVFDKVLQTGLINFEELKSSIL